MSSTETNIGHASGEIEVQLIEIFSFVEAQCSEGISERVIETHVSPAAGVTSFQQVLTEV